MRDDPDRAAARKRKGDARGDRKTPARRSVTIKPVPERIGEDEENLRRRAEWFRRRSGQREKRQG